jgi:hypothetical protein
MEVLVPGGRKKGLCGFVFGYRGGETRGEGEGDVGWVTSYYVDATLE